VNYRLLQTEPLFGIRTFDPNPADAARHGCRTDRDGEFLCDKPRALIASFREFKLSSEVCSKPAMLSGIIRDDELGAATILRRRFCIRFDIEYDDP
jgi:hypothetical protein